MRILFVVSNNSPFDPKNGAEQRTCLLLKACAKVGIVDVIDFCDDEVYNSFGTNIIFSKRLNSTTNVICAKMDMLVTMLFSFLPSRMSTIDRKRKKIINDYLKKESYDFIVTRYVLSAIGCGLYKYADRLVVDVDDSPVFVLQILNKQSTSLKMHLFYSVYTHNVRIAMKCFDRKIHKALYSNSDDCISPNALLLPNIPFYDIECMQSESLIIKNRLLFVGEMKYGPNIEAIDRFLGNIYMKIKECCEDTSLHIVGRCSDSNKVKWETYPGVKVMGFVPSLDKEYAEACLFVLPMYNGGGTCIKFLEAAQMGRTIVTTECGFRGYSRSFDADVDCCVASDDDSFAEIVIELLGDEDKRISIANSANAKFKQYYSHRYFDSVVRSALCE